MRRVDPAASFFPGATILTDRKAVSGRIVRLVTMDSPDLPLLAASLQALVGSAHWIWLVMCGSGSRMS
jgi:hypothetical protein